MRQSSFKYDTDLDYRDIFLALPGPYAILDREFRVVAANAPYCAATLTTLPEIEGRSIFEIFPEKPDGGNAQGVAELRASLTRVLEFGQPDAMPLVKYDIPTSQKDFEERYWSTLNFPILAKNKILWVVIRVEDVTTLVRMKAEDEARDQLAQHQRAIIDELRSANSKLADTLGDNLRLRDNQYYFANIIDSSTDAILGTDLEGTILSWNKAAERLYGYTAAEIIGHPNATIIPPEVMPIERGINRRIKCGEVIPHYETVRLKKNGALAHVSLTASPVCDATGRIIGISKIAQDITERKRAELALKELEAERLYLADIVESSNDAIIGRNLAGEIISWNRAAQRMFGYTSEEVRGLSTSVLAPPDLRAEAESVLQRLQQGERAVHYETRRVRKDGVELLVSVTASIVRNFAGEVTGTSAIMRDITAEREAVKRMNSLQNEVIHLSRWNTMGMMASTLAHELNQPLTAGMNYVRAAQRTLGSENADPLRASEFLDKAVGEIKLAGGVIRSLRQFIDKRETHRELHDLNLVVEEALTLGVAGGWDNRINIVSSFDRTLPLMVMDKIQIEQVLLNLVRNAFDAMQTERNGNVTIEVKQGETGFAEVSVSDSGPGIAPDVLAKLFQPFVTTKSNGMGIGLTICQSIIEAHGGRIWTETNQPRGISVNFRLPLNGETV